MLDFAEQLAGLGQRTDQALGTLEQDGRWAEALEVYAAAGAELDALGIPRGEGAYRAGRKLRAYLYLRQANALRALGRPAEAGPLADLELEAAMASGDSLTIARAMFSLGASCVAGGQVERGLNLLADARPMFEHHADLEHRQGLGWWHLVQADLLNSDLAPGGPAAALQSAQTALEILRPLENWPGIVRAHAARARALEQLGDENAARVARTAEQMAAARLNQGRV